MTADLLCQGTWDNGQCGTFCKIEVDLKLVTARGEQCLQSLHISKI